ncbi:hypothetical protein [Streptomyces prasinopilosus]|uniref:Lipoprotein n=1 Tax=Streptomyces prasinopilosus TaxID=67344 RepID=A0A1G7AGQ3_9ACTN|nr:hypothetical protein [Streptomyces prasinopilosus]SDE13647.1 hypothetical protein SAMN05216505_11849 [Streptomyces prasinopilosus]
MPFPPAPRARTGPRRRSLLAVAPAALLAAGCSAGPRDPGPSAGSPSPASERARARAARDSRELARRYDAVIAAHAGLARRLGPLRENAVRHARAFEDLGTAAGPASASPGSPAPTGAGPSAPAPVPAKEEDALSGLAAAEREIAARRLEALLDAPAELAGLLASVAAAGAAHAFLLTEG